MMCLGHRLLLLLLLALSAPLDANAVPVRAVEHPEYSRLVLPVPDGVTAHLSQDDARAVLSLFGPVPDYDVTTIFERMPRTRILSARIETDPAGLRLILALACSCEVTVVRLERGYLGVDVRRAGPAAMEARTLAPPEPPVPAAPAIGQDLAQLEQAVRHAAREGVLTPSPEATSKDISPAPNSATLPAPEPQSYEVQPPELEPLAGTGREAELSPHISIRGAGLTRPGDASEPVDSIAPCGDELALDVRLWKASAPDFSTGLAERRRLLVDDAGIIRPEALADLARFYIVAGFGREAGQLLSRLGDDVSSVALLADLARVVEGGKPSIDGPLAKATDCVGRASLWRMASGIEQADPASPGTGAAERALEELPAPLRRRLGSMLADRMLSEGQADAAQDILELLRRTPGVAGLAETIVEARLALGEGDSEEVLALTVPWVRDVASPDPEALLLYGEAMLVQASPPPRWLEDAVFAALPAYPGDTRRGRDLRVLVAHLMAARGAATEALASLRRIPIAGPEARDAVATAGRRILSLPDAGAKGSASAAAALLANLEFLDDTADGEALRLEYARALIAGGLPNVALRILSNSDRVETREIAILRAEAHISEGALEKAITLLEPMRDPAAEALVAKARLRLGVADAPSDAPMIWRTMLFAASPDAVAQVAGLTRASSNAMMTRPGLTDQLPSSQIAEMALMDTETLGAGLSLLSDLQASAAPGLTR